MGLRHDSLSVPGLISYPSAKYGYVRLHVLSVFMFVAWIVAGSGWILLLAPLWLIYPLLISYRLLRQSRTQT
jgi:hypothetical protein